jgi:hypothetical protein
LPRAATGHGAWLVGWGMTRGDTRQLAYGGQVCLTLPGDIVRQAHEGEISKLWVPNLERAAWRREAMASKAAGPSDRSVEWWGESEGRLTSSDIR